MSRQLQVAPVSRRVHVVGLLGPGRQALLSRDGGGNFNTNKKAVAR